MNIAIQTTEFRKAYNHHKIVAIVIAIMTRDIIA